MDYQGGQKFDWIKLGIPLRENEGYWSIHETIKVLEKNQMKIIKIVKYPYSPTKLLTAKRKFNLIIDFFRISTEYGVIAIKN